MLEPDAAVAALSTEHPELGSPCLAMTDITPQIRGDLYVGLAAVAFWLIVFFLALACWLVGWPFKGEPSSCLVLLLICLAFLPSGIRYLSAIRHPDQLLVVFPGGFYYANSEQNRLIRWEDIDSVRSLKALEGSDPFHGHHLITPRYDVFCIHLGSGEKLCINNYLSGYVKVIDEITNRSFPVLLKRATDAYERREPITFGAFEVHESALGYKGRLLPWDQLQYIMIDKGALTIERKGFSVRAWCNHAVADIPNFSVFQVLVDRACTGRSTSVWMN